MLTASNILSTWATAIENEPALDVTEVALNVRLCPADSPNHAHVDVTAGEWGGTVSTHLDKTVEELRDTVTQRVAELPTLVLVTATIGQAMDESGDVEDGRRALAELLANGKISEEQRDMFLEQLNEFEQSAGLAQQVGAAFAEALGLDPSAVTTGEGGVLTIDASKIAGGEQVFDDTVGAPAPGTKAGNA